MGFLTHKIYGLNAQKWVKHTLFVGLMQYGLKTHTSDLTSGDLGLIFSVLDDF